MSYKMQSNGNKKVIYLWTIKKCFVAFFIFGVLFLPNFIFAQDNDKGTILNVTSNKSIIKRGDTVKVTVEVQSLQRGKHHQLVVVNILDSDGKAIYDSHSEDEDIDFVIGYRERKTVGPFFFKVPHNTRPGTYKIFTGYREYPWEPLITFQGDKWNPPVKKIIIK